MKRFADRYRIVKRLGTVASGRLYHALDEDAAEAEVALEIYGRHLVERPQTVRRFIDVIETVGELEHPHLVSLRGYGIHAGELYLVREHLRGRALSARLAEGPMSLEEAAAIFVPILEAVDVAHAAGVAHQMITPDTIFLAEGSAGQRPVLLGLGLGALSELGNEPGEDGAGFTGIGEAVGPPAYMSPEQAVASTHLTPATDFWTLGVILYQAITGKLPFRFVRADAVEMLHAVCSEAPVPFEERVAGLPARFADLVERCLERGADDRPRRVGKLATGLREAVLESHQVRLLDAEEPEESDVAGIIRADSIRGDDRPTDPAPPMSAAQLDEIPTAAAVAVQAGIADLVALRASLEEAQYLALHAGMDWNEENEGATVVDLRHQERASATSRVELPVVGANEPMRLPYVDFTHRRRREVAGESTKIVSRESRGARAWAPAVVGVLLGVGVVFGMVHVRSEAPVDDEVVSAAAPASPAIPAAPAADAVPTPGPDPAAEALAASEDELAAIEEALLAEEARALAEARELRVMMRTAPATMGAATMESATMESATMESAPVEPTPSPESSVMAIRIRRRAVLSTGAVIDVGQFPGARFDSVADDEPRLADWSND